MTELTNEQSVNIIALGSKLSGLGIQATFSRVESGPVVTAYYFRLAMSESIKKVMNKAEDLALAMEAAKVVLQRVGGEIALFVPNKERKIIEFKDYLYWYLNDENVKKERLPVPLGVDFHGVRSTFDLCSMPHCLVTGSTDSGKSVFEASIISALSLFRPSSELHFYLCDTKKLDLPLFADLPHVKMVAKDTDDFHDMIDGVMQLTRARNDVLHNASCRNVHDFHKMNGNIECMPYVIVMIDEFGDLMELDDAIRKSSDKYDDKPTVKSWIKSASQICRAAGVHLICCTQRASVKVIDGDIKANLPCRISLRLPTQIDSRTVLGTGGAENLLGKGDMLILRPGKDSLERFHGPFVSMNDIAELITQYDYMKQIFARS